MNFPLYIARKIYNDQGDKHKVSRPVIRIATLGVAIGLAVMVISVSVVFGFKHTIRDKVIGFGSHITVGDYTTLQGNDQYPIEMGDSMMKVLKSIKGVEKVQRYAMKQGILKTDSDFLGVMFKGVAEEYDTTFIHQNMVEGHFPVFSDQASKQQIVISKMIADQLHLHAGDRIFAYFFNNDQVRPRRYTIVGIYQTNLTMFDKVMCFIDLYSAVKLNSWERDQASGAELTVADFSRLDEVEDILSHRVNRSVDRYGATYSSTTIQENYPQIFSWLDLLDLNVWIILALMVCVAGFTMISGLLIIILERTNFIGIMKALGARNRQMRYLFVNYALLIIVRGIVLGNVLAFALILLQKYTGIITLDPDVYYVEAMPVLVNWLWVACIDVGTLIISALAMIVPSFVVSHITPAKSIRFE